MDGVTCGELRKLVLWAKIRTRRTIKLLIIMPMALLNTKNHISNNEYSFVG